MKRFHPISYRIQSPELILPICALCLYSTRLQKNSNQFFWEFLIVQPSKLLIEFFRQLTGPYLSWHYDSDTYFKDLWYACFVEITFSRYSSIVSDCMLKKTLQQMVSLTWVSETTMPWDHFFHTGAENKSFWNFITWRIAPWDFCDFFCFLPFLQTFCFWKIRIWILYG